MEKSVNENHVIVIENGLDKECSALGGLFQQIVNEMKVGGGPRETTNNKQKQRGIINYFYS